jgi:spore germination cell wall hydrolase CwlJ-like protein
MSQEESLIKNDFEQDISEIESYLTQIGETIRETRSPMSSSDLAPKDSLMPQPRPGTVGVGDFSDLEILALTLQAEAGGEGELGMLAAGSVIANRAASGKYGKGISGVIMKPGQFSAWNGVTGYYGGKGGIDMDKVRPSSTALKVARDIISGNYEDVTGGATHYYNPKVASPKWGGEVGDNWFDIGNHRFGKPDQ